jgi:hypothetical protein
LAASLLSAQATAVRPEAVHRDLQLQQAPLLEMEKQCPWRVLPLQGILPEQGLSALSARGNPATTPTRAKAKLLAADWRPLLVARDLRRR